MEQKRTRRTFDPSFKHHAALRVVEGKEKAAAVAADLGLDIVRLYIWAKDYEKTKATAIANAQSQAAQAAESAPTTQTPVETSSPIESPVAEAPRRPKLQLKKRPPEPTEAAAPTAVTPAAAAPAPVSPAPAVSMPAPAPTFSNEPRVFSPTPEPAVQETRSAPEVKEPAFETPASHSEFSSNNSRRENFQQRDKGNRRNSLFQRTMRGRNASKNEKALHDSFIQSAVDNAVASAQAKKTQENKPQLPKHNPNIYQIPAYDMENELPVDMNADGQEAEEPKWPVPSASQGRSWKVMHALDQRPNYKEESAKFGYVDEFDLPAENLPEVWAILDLMQKNADKHAFEEMVHSKDLNVPPEVLADPRTMVISGPNVPNKPWLRKPRLNPIAEDFFQTTPDYSKSVYETYGGITLRLAKNSTGSPILLVEPSPNGGKDVTIDFSKFDRFVDDFYGDFVRDCKTVMMKQNPKEYPSLNAFIRIPDEPMWNPKLWAGVRTFNWRDGESLSEAWIRYAYDQRRNSRHQKYFYRTDRE